MYMQPAIVRFFVPPPPKLPLALPYLKALVDADVPVRCFANGWGIDLRRGEPMAPYANLFLTPLAPKFANVVAGVGFARLWTDGMLNVAIVDGEPPPDVGLEKFFVIHPGTCPPAVFATSLKALL